LALLPIIRMGHPILRQPASPVIDPTDAEIAALIGDMIETMEAANGVGLAATQVAQPLRLVVFFVPPGRNDGEEIPLTVLINPEIEPLDDLRQEAFEGCLSVPGLTGSVPRYDHIRYRGVDQTGQKIEREARGFHARVVQHEVDHLDGILYVQRMEDLSQLGYVEEMRDR